MPFEFLSRPSTVPSLRNPPKPFLAVVGGGPIGSQSYYGERKGEKLRLPILDEVVE